MNSHIDIAEKNIDINMTILEKSISIRTFLKILIFFFQHLFRMKYTVLCIKKC